jgi:DNA-binding CsgD family transcriptional regulator
MRPAFPENIMSETGASRTGYIPESIALALLRAVGDDDFYSRLFTAIAEVLPFDGGAVMEFFGDRKPAYLFHKPSAVRTVPLDAYFQGPYVLDPLFSLHMTQGVGDGVYWLQDVAGDDFYSSEYYHAFYKRTDALDVIDVHVLAPAGRRLSLFLVRCQSSRKFRREEVQLMESLEPLVRAAVLRHITLAADRLVQAGEPDMWHRKLQVTYAQFATGLLTERERQILMYVLNGYSAGLTGQRLAISEGTVRNHRKSIYRKLDIGSQAELLALFLGCVPFADPAHPADPLRAYEARTPAAACTE